MKALFLPIFALLLGLHLQGTQAFGSWRVSLDDADEDFHKATVSKEITPQEIEDGIKATNGILKALEPLLQTLQAWGEAIGKSFAGCCKSSQSQDDSQAAPTSTSAPAPSGNSGEKKALKSSKTVNYIY